MTNPVEFRGDPFPHVLVKDGSGATRVTIDLAKSGPLLLFFDRHGNPVGGASVAADGQVRVTLLNAAGSPRASIFLGDDGQALVASMEGEGPDLHVTNIRPACDPPPSLDPFPSFN